MRAVSRWYKNDKPKFSQLESMKRDEVGVRWPPVWESVVRQSLASKDVNTEVWDLRRCKTLLDNDL
jgi:hypothetical protein